MVMCFWRILRGFVCYVFPSDFIRYTSATFSRINNIDFINLRICRLISDLIYFFTHRLFRPPPPRKILRYYFACDFARFRFPAVSPVYSRRPSAPLRPSSIQSLPAFLIRATQLVRGGCPAMVGQIAFHFRNYLRCLLRLFYRMKNHCLKTFSVNIGLTSRAIPLDYSPTTANVLPYRL